MIERLILILSLLSAGLSGFDAGKVEQIGSFFTYELEVEEDWQQAYFEVLETVRQQNVNREENPEHSSVSENYYLYDIDKDKVPELLVEYGGCEADYCAEIYTFKDGEAIYIDTIGTGHTVFYSWPGENAMMAYWGHMGAVYVDKVSLIDGELVYEQIFGEYVEAYEEYTDEQELVPGALDIDYYRTEQDLPLVAFASIEKDERFYLESAEGVDNEAVKERLLAVMEEDGFVYGVSGDGFGGDTGYVSFSTYCEPEVAARFADFSMEVEEYTWMDLNGDGQVECIVKLLEAADPDDEEADRKEITTILNLQDNLVYAYCFNYIYDYTLYEDGVWAGENFYHHAFRVCFDKDECFDYYVEFSP